PDRQLVWAERAKEQFIKADKPVHAAWMDLDIADALIYSSRYEEAEKVLDALDREEYESSRQFRKTALRNRLALYAHTDRYEELTETFNSMLENGVAIRAFDYYNLAASYIKRGEPERAAQYRDSVARHAKTRSDSLCLYHLDSRLMRSGDDRDRSLQSIEAFANEMMLLSEAAVMHPETLILADNYSLKAALAAERAEKERERIVWLSIGAVLLVIAAAFGMLYMRNRLRIRRLEGARLREDLSRSESRSTALETDVANLTEQISAYRRNLEQKEEAIETINREKGAIELMIAQAEEKYRERIKTLEGEYHELEKEYESVRLSSAEMSGRIEQIMNQKKELEAEHRRLEADYHEQIDALMTSRSSIEHERDELRMICEKMAVMEKIIERFNAGDMPERTRKDCKPLLEHDRLMSETVYSLCRMEGSNGMPKVAQTVDELIDKLKDKEYLEKYVRAVDVMNNNWLKATLTELDMKPAEIELITYLYIGLTPEAIARLMEKKNTLNVNTAKSKLRKRLLNKAPERRQDFCRFLNMRKGGEN
ncbi:MAG: hypothetical protein K2M57_09195, partial [Paramuribaculum sp.]|nr:hypothetical protein [Paramuribaculum sp.]